MIRLTLPLPDRKLSPNARPHWAPKAKATKHARRLAWAYARIATNAKPTRWEMAEARAVFYFPTAHRRDRDNAAASLKAYWDGIADAGVVENDAGLIHWPPEMKVDRENPRVEITITERTK